MSGAAGGARRRVSIAIVTYDNEKVLGPTLEALAAHWPTEVDARLHVVDNASRDGSVALVETTCARLGLPLSLRRSESGNVGFGAAHDLLIPHLDSDYHVVMNPDIMLPDGSAIPALAAFLDASPDVGMCVPRILDPAGRQQFLCRRPLTVLDVALRFLAPGRLLRRRQEWHMMMDHDYAATFDVPFASGCFLMVRTALFRELGGFDPRIFLYGEDADLTRRVNAVSRTAYVPQGTVVHAWQRASYRTRNMFLIHLKSLAYYFRKWGWRLW